MQMVALNKILNKVTTQLCTKRVFLDEYWSIRLNSPHQKIAAFFSKCVSVLSALNNFFSVPLSWNWPHIVHSPAFQSLPTVFISSLMICSSNLKTHMLYGIKGYNLYEYLQVSHRFRLRSIWSIFEIQYRNLVLFYFLLNVPQLPFHFITTPYFVDKFPLKWTYFFIQLKQSVNVMSHPICLKWFKRHIHSQVYLFLHITMW